MANNVVVNRANRKNRYVAAEVSMDELGGNAEDETAMQQYDSQIELESLSSKIGDEIGTKVRNKSGKKQTADGFSMPEGELLLNVSAT